MSERVYHEAFLALGRDDPDELARQADAVLGGGNDNAQKVAVLRALFAIDRARAPAYFLRAITTLPDRSQPSGVSVPSFALAYLCKRASDPGIRGTLEQVAMGTAAANVSAELRRQAAKGLLVNASPAERTRYSYYPVFQDLVGGDAVQ